MTTENESMAPGSAAIEQDYIALLEELEESRSTTRKLQEQLKKALKAVEIAERSAAEATRAHAKMVATLTETMRENTALTIDRDMWKARAQRYTVQVEEPAHPAWDLQASIGITQITEDEASAIRKAIARLHHPDSGGNLERMKLWNASLDRLERRP